MQSDEQAVRQLVATWHEATGAGEVARILPLMADDVVFLAPGRPIMRGRQGFRERLEALLQHHRINSSSEIQEIQISGDMAYCWSSLVVTVTPLEQEGSPSRRTGDALTILRKQPNGTWVVARDANMLASDPIATT